MYGLYVLWHISLAFWGVLTVRAWEVCILGHVALQQYCDWINKCHIHVRQRQEVDKIENCNWNTLYTKFINHNSHAYVCLWLNQYLPKRKVACRAEARPVLLDARHLGYLGLFKNDGSTQEKGGQANFWPKELNLVLIHGRGSNIQKKIGCCTRLH